jgi:hypothetical protein
MSTYDIQNVSNISPLASDDEFDGNDFLDYSHEMLSIGGTNADDTQDIKRYLAYGTQSVSNYVELQLSHSTFVDCATDSKPVGLTFSLDKELISSEFIAISIFCIPNCTTEEDFISRVEKKRVKGLDYLNLAFRLVYLGGNNLSYNTEHQNINSEAGIPINAAVYNGEYCLTLANRSERLKQGQYVLYLSVVNNENEVGYSAVHIQTLRITYNISNEVDATSVVPGSPTQGKLAAGEVKYFRFVFIENSKAIRISLKAPKKDSNTLTKRSSIRSYPSSLDTETNLDLFVTNKFCGLYPVTKETAVWSTRDNNKVVEILPTEVKLANNQDDIASNTFIICVSGSNKENFDLETQLEMSFELLVEITDYHPLIHNSLNDFKSIRNSSATSNQYYSNSNTMKCGEMMSFSLEFDPTERVQIAVVLNLLKSSLHRSPAVYETFRDIPELRQKKEIVDSLISGVSCESTHVLEMLSSLTKDVVLDPEEFFKEGHFYTVVYISDTVKYPNAENCKWMVRNFSVF